MYSRSEQDSRMTASTKVGLAAKFTTQSVLVESAY